MIQAKCDERALKKLNIAKKWKMSYVRRRKVAELKWDRAIKRAKHFFFPQKWFCK